MSYNPLKENRRSRRILASVPLEVRVGEDTCIVLSAVINLNGALVLSPKNWSPQTVLHVTNRHTGAETNGRIVWSGSRTEAGTYKLGVEFQSAAPEFWGDDYDAEGGEEAP
jgi:hypothetical protein